MYEKFRSFLQTHKSTKVSVSELEALASADTAYSHFSQVVQKLLDEEILIPVKKHGYNTKQPPLPLTYRIQKSFFTQPLKQEIQSFQLVSHSAIILDNYFKLSESRWKQDLPVIQKVNDYLNKHGIPRQDASAPERSYQIMGDEKWIDDKGGKKLLEDIGIWQSMKISSVPDPLMLAINSNCLLSDRVEHHHLVVENKATYYAILPVLQDLSYSSLVYGAGWKIVSGIQNHLIQIGSKNKTLSHTYHYFGDLDHEGIFIWMALFDRIRAVPAIGLYRALVEKTFAKGKEYQRVNEVALGQFLSFFSENEQQVITSLLSQGCYIPQEALSVEELQDQISEKDEVKRRNE